jgi:hypothetical protein
LDALVAGAAKNAGFALRQGRKLLGYVDNFAARRYNVSFALSIKTLS